MIHKKRIIILIAGIVVGAGLTYQFLHERSAKSGNIIRISGNIEATLVKVSFKIPGRISQRLVDEGYIVKQGNLIAKLEDRELIDQKNKAESAMKALEAKIPSLLTTIEKEEKTSEDEVTHAEANLRAAQALLAKLLNGARPQEVEQAEAEAHWAKSELEKEEKLFVRMKQLYEKDYVAAQDWDTAKASYEVARAKHKKAGENYALVKEGPRKEEIEEARAQMEKAKASLSMSHSKKLQVKVYRHELEVQKAQLKEASAGLEIAKRQLEYSQVFAPVSGVVLTKSAEEGEYVSSGNPVVTIADLDHVWVKAYVDETELGRVKIGQGVKITTDTFPGKIYEGKVSFISSEAEFTPKQVQTQKERVKLVYRIKVNVENRQRELKPGMPADAEIIL